MGLTALSGLAAALAAVAVGIAPAQAGRIRDRLHRSGLCRSGPFSTGSRLRRPRTRRNAGYSPVLALVAALGRRLTGGESPDEVLIGGAALALPAVAVAAGPAPVGIALAAVAGVVGLRRRHRRLDRQRRVELALPEVVDLLGLLVGAGQPAAPALAAAGPRSPEPFRSELADVVRRSSAGEPFAESIRRMRDRLGPAAAPLVHAVLAAEVDGVPLGPALVRVGDEARRRRRVRAEEAARRVPVLMLFPLVFCVLPAFGLLTVVPLMAGSIADLRFPG